MRITINGQGMCYVAVSLGNKMCGYIYVGLFSGN
jgi:hypothetical protein